MRVNQKLITNTNGGSEFLIVSICYDMGLLGKVRISHMAREHLLVTH